MQRMTGALVLLGSGLWAALWGFTSNGFAQAVPPAEAAFQAGQEAVARNDQAGATGRFLEAARGGHAEAAYLLGLTYGGGREIFTNPPEAVKWMRVSAEKGYGPAQDSMGLWSLTGWILPQNPAEAARWFRKAADQGSPSAMYFLGTMYAQGNGVEKNPEWALTWFRHAANRKFPVPPDCLTEAGVRQLGQTR